ncbi:DoxX family protein [Saccharomonospora sp. NPDC046836]|uniref:DoxX family protein n=1 Tax=Saccharomonospora sp. NPDC046836 TaxID=3156921 RepID=UPI0033E0B769
MSARIPPWLRMAFYWVLAAEFFVGFATKFWPGPTFFGPAYSVKFVDWGFPAWFRFVAGAIELICAILLVIPHKRFRFIGAAGLVFLLTAAVTTHLIDDAALYEEVSAPIHLVIMTMVALANWPADWKDLIHPQRDNRAAPASARGVEHSTP